MKTFNTVTDILNNAQDFHNYAKSFYAKIQDNSSDERSKMLLSFMAQHEEDMSSKLQVISTKSSQNVLDTWVQFTVEETPEAFFDSLQQDGGYSISSISNIGQSADSYLESVFQEGVETAVTEDIKELFQSLAAMEALQKQQLSKAASSIWDM